MNLVKLSAISAVLMGSVVASPAVFAHASYIISGNGTSSPQWLNGVPTLGVEAQNPAVGANIPTIGFAGIHGATTSNARVIETGVYGSSANVGASALGGLFGNATTYNTTPGVTNAVTGGNTGGSITPGQGNTYLGQLYNFNTAPGGSKNPNSLYFAPTLAAVDVAQGSLTAANLTAINGGNNSAIYNPGAANTGMYNANGFNSGLLYENPYVGSGSTYVAANGTTPASLGSAPNGELNIIASTGAQFLNVAIAADANVSASNFLTTGASEGSNSGQDKLTYAIYEGIATGPGLQGLTLLGTGEASGVGKEVDFSIALTGSYLNGPQSGGEFTLVVGDDSNGVVSAANFDQYVKVGFFETGNSTTLTTNGSGSYATVYNEKGTNPSAVPVPGAVWLFGSALAGFAGFGRRKAVKA